ncbi:BON domain-containing protein [Pseudoxanthomonas sp. SE1]|uniref:BON domain-containing protein n=1 Tax=Pseudoxanthomonas sp. SE1 TaxID=1664560 RepID=UPI00240E3A70|nr:BON domain-containing protein [Pseudoxanthomonas sp. SE1]WFC41551.1 BON domain-containing protein [Pseudoxanthomonas sp. SE1]
MNDKQLRQAVIDELDFEPSLDSADVGVLAEDGVITLTGHVPTYYQKLSAERAAWRVKGVKAIAQNIEVRFASDTSDEEIAKRALGVLKWSSTVPSDIHLTVNKGWITLEGKVDWQYQRTGAESALRSLRGVTGISNNIVIKPTVQVPVVQQRIEDALRRSADVEAKQIRIAVKNGDTVTLDGKVDTWSERVAVERAVWSTPGVKDVIDHLVIT